MGEPEPHFNHSALWGRRRQPSDRLPAGWGQWISRQA